jgi:hypothetical protein
MSRPSGQPVLRAPLGLALVRASAGKYWHVLLTLQELDPDLGYWLMQVPVSLLLSP